MGLPVGAPNSFSGGLVNGSGKNYLKNQKGHPREITSSGTPKFWGIVVFFWLIFSGFGFIWSYAKPQYWPILSRFLIFLQSNNVFLIKQASWELCETKKANHVRMRGRLFQSLAGGGPTSQTLKIINWHIVITAKNSKQRKNELSFFLLFSCHSPSSHDSGYKICELRYVFWLLKAKYILTIV